MDSICPFILILIYSNFSYFNLWMCVCALKMNFIFFVCVLAMGKAQCVALGRIKEQKAQPIPSHISYYR